MSNEKKYYLCKKISFVLEGIAILLIGGAMSAVDSEAYLPILIMMGIGGPVALLGFFVEKLSYYYKREAKKDREKQVRKEQLRSIMFNGEYTKLSA